MGKGSKPRGGYTEKYRDRLSLALHPEQCSPDVIIGAIGESESRAQVQRLRSALQKITTPLVESERMAIMRRFNASVPTGLV